MFNYGVELSFHVNPRLPIHVELSAISLHQDPAHHILPQKSYLCECQVM